MVKRAEYVVEMYDLYTPLIGGINRTVVNDFEKMLSKNSHFKIWYDKNLSTIQKIGDKYDLSVYLDPDVNVDQIQYAGREKKISVPSSHQPIPLTTKNDLHKALLIGIIFYLYSPKKLDPTKLPIPKSNTNNMKGGVKFGESISDISGSKAFERQIFLFQNEDSPQKYCMKIVPSAEKRYIKEINIYYELNSLDKTDINITDKIVKMLDAGRILGDNLGFDAIVRVFPDIDVQDNGTYDDIFAITIDDEDILFNNTYLFNQIINFRDKMGNLLYYVTEKDDDYVTMADIVRGKYYVGLEDKICPLIDHIFTTLEYLNNLYGFVHWDLHFDNLLIDTELDNFKLFDFDLSSTNQVKNYEIIKRLPSLRKVYYGFSNKNDLREFGYFYDMVNFVLRLPDDIFGEIFRCDDVRPELKKYLSNIRNNYDYLLSNPSTYYIELPEKVREFYLDTKRIYVGGKSNYQIAQNKSDENNYQKKYIKYKTKYLDLVNNLK